MSFTPLLYLLGIFPSYIFYFVNMKLSGGVLKAVFLSSFCESHFHNSLRSKIFYEELCGAQNE